MPRLDDAARDLLFGLLALQNGMITRDQLVAAFGAWTAMPGRPMADFLVDQGALTPSRRALLDALAAEHVAAHGGDPEASLVSLDLGSSTRDTLAHLAGPALASSLGMALASIERFLGIPDIAMPPLSDGSPLMPTTLFPADITANSEERFRLLRPHARGGLGAVFVALDTELNREVALKQILDHHADDPSSRQRFLIEAEITGGLEHPGIVPVYSLGSYESGRPYYAMRLIKGDTLRDEVARFHADASLREDSGRRSLELRKLLGWYTDVCNAVGYAHSRGVLHRDIKPSNVIVGRYGETLVVDWGLAKATGQSDADPASGERTLLPSSASGGAETLPGSAMGTPAFMSPEQARGDIAALGPRSDVYSLGATLFCLLTGKVPFEGDVGELLRRVQACDFPPPRRLDPSIDRALEAICLKAMATDPSARYPSCRALADDVERWAADEPVTAWREPFARRVRRWARRNRTPVTAAAVTLIAAVLGLAAVLAVQTKAGTELARSKALVQARYDLAVDAIGTFHTGVSGDFLLKQDQFKELRDRLLNSAADFYGKLGKLLGTETDLVSRRALAQAYFEVANLTQQVGRSEDALAAHSAVLTRREALAADPETKADVGRSLIAVASLLESTGKTVEAETTYRRAEAMLASLLQSSPSHSSTRAALAACRSGLGSLLSTTSRPADALTAYRLARADLEALAALPGASTDVSRELAITLDRLGILLAETGKPRDAEAEFRKALALRQKLADLYPAVIDFQSGLAKSHSNLARVLSETGQSSEAEAEFRRALALVRKLAEENPALTAFRTGQAVIRTNLGILLTETGKLSEAEAEHREALALYQKLADDHPAVTDFRTSLGGSHGNLGGLLTEVGRPEEAEAEDRAALAIFRKLAQENSTLTDSQRNLALSHSNLGSLLSETGKLAEAEAEYREALALFRKLAEENPTVSDFRNNLADNHYNLGILLARTGKRPGAEAEYRKSLALFQKLAEENPARTVFSSGLADNHKNLGILLSATGELPAAEAEYREAVVHYQKLADDYPAVADFRSGLSASLSGLGGIQQRDGRISEALDSLRKALTLSERVPTRSSGDLYNLACQHALLSGAASEPGSGLTRAEAQAEADLAMDSLRRAVAAGYGDASNMQTDTDLDSLRGRNDFRILMMDLAMPAEPFANGRSMTRPR
jgi:eukaryotic-like serine/threonine-protein kinase